MDVLVATWEAGLFVFREGRRERQMPDAHIACLASDGDGGALAVTDGKSVRRCSRESAWKTIATSTFDLSSCVSLGGAIFVGTNDARVLRLEKDGPLTPLEAFDHVAGRETWYAGTAVVDGRTVGPPLGVRSMCATADAKVVLVNVHVGGIPRSADLGETWKPTIDVESDVHEVSAHPVRHDVVAAATALGLALSHDGGVTWTLEREGLHAPHCAAVRFVGDEVWVSATKDPFDKEGAVYRRSIDHAGRLARVGGGLPRWLDGKVDTGCIASLGETIALADAGGHVYVSDDGGTTFSCIAEGLPFPSGVLLLA
jgi:hypothetical protein